MKTDNELIAEFMGQHVTIVGLRRNVMQKSYYADELKYDTSWDWLMPVVEKIQTEHFLICGIEESAHDKWGMYSGITIYGKNWKSFYWSGYSELITLIEDEKQKGNPSPTKHRVPCCSKIEAVYKAVVEFIKWHNANK